MFKRLLFLSLMVTTALACVACGAPMQSNVPDDLQTVASWTATAHAVGDAWLRGQVPDAYAQQTLEAAAQSLGEENDAVTNYTASPRRDALIGHMQRLTPLVQHMIHAVEQNDHTALTKLIVTLSTEQQDVAALAKQARMQP